VPVTGVPAIAPGRVMLRIAETGIHLAPSAPSSTTLVSRPSRPPGPVSDRDVSKPGPVRKPAGAIWPAQPATDAEPHAPGNRQAVASGAVMGNLSTTIMESPPNR